MLGELHPPLFFTPAFRFCRVPPNSVAPRQLPWEDACLSFHLADRPVRTASATQVRQPIYKTSVGCR